MFSKTKINYENIIKRLKKQIKYMFYEWDREKELYNTEMRDMFYTQKVKMVIGGINFTECRSVHRPLYNLTEDEAKLIAEKVKKEVEVHSLNCITGYHWNVTNNCYVIDVEIVGQKSILSNSTEVLLIDNIVDDYRQKIIDLLTTLKSKTVVFDFDGTLTEFKYAPDKIVPCENKNMNDYAKEHDVYKYTRVLKTMQYIIQELNPNDIFVVTVSQDSITQSKDNCLYRCFNSISSENIWHVNNADDKFLVLERIYEKTGKDIVFIEDTIQTLIKAESMYNFVKGYHISSLLP